MRGFLSGPDIEDDATALYQEFVRFNRSVADLLQPYFERVLIADYWPHDVQDPEDAHWYVAERKTWLKFFPLPYLDGDELFAVWPLMSDGLRVKIGRQVPESAYSDIEAAVRRFARDIGAKRIEYLGGVAP